MVGVTFAATAWPAPPANDNFANSIEIAAAGETVTGTNVEATSEVGEPDHAQANPNGGRSVWWHWTAPSSGTVTLDTATSDFDTVLSVYTGAAVNALTLVVEADDVVTGTFTTRLAFPAVSGTTYRIAVDGFEGATGAVSLSLVPGGPGPANDNFLSAGVIPIEGGTTSGDTTNASREGGEPLHANRVGIRSIWWQWTPAADVNITIDTGGSDFDTVLAVYTGASMQTLVEVDSNDDDGLLETSRVSFSASGGMTYRIAVDGYAGESGSVSLRIGESGGVAPANDRFANATVFPPQGGTISGNSTGSSKEAGEPLHAGNIGGKSVWWTWTATVNGPVSINTAGSNFDTLLAVYTGATVDALAEVASDDDDGIFKTSRVDFDAVAGTPYWIAVDGYDGESGRITITISAVTDPPAPPVANGATGVTAGAFDANWTGVSGAAGYRIDVSTSRSFDTFVPGYQDFDAGSTTTLNISGLSGVTIYYYRVRAYNALGSGENSQTISVTTGGTPGRLINMSARSKAGSGASTLIVGFAIDGTGVKRVVIRGVGPKLSELGVTEPVVADPAIRLYDISGNVLAENDDWVSTTAANVGGFSLPPGSKDAALDVELAPGAYTVHLVNTGAPAEALVELYDISQDALTRFVNLSCRLDIAAGQIVIFGAAVQGGGRPLIVRNAGPSLAPLLQPHEQSLVAQDPFLRFYDSSNSLFGETDDWDPSLQPRFAAVGAYSWITGSKDSADRIGVQPGTFTAHASVLGEGGIILIEMYADNP